MTAAAPAATPNRAASSKDQPCARRSTIPPSMESPAPTLLRSGTAGETMRRALLGSDDDRAARA